MTGRVRRLTVTGGGLIGSEIAAGLAAQGRDVLMLFPEAGIGFRTYPRGLSSFLNDYYRARGVDVRAGEQVVGAVVKGDGLSFSLHLAVTAVKSALEADVAVAGVNIQPSVDLAREAELVIARGIRVQDAPQSLPRPADTRPNRLPTASGAPRNPLPLPSPNPQALRRADDNPRWRRTSREDSRPRRPALLRPSSLLATPKTMKGPSRADAAGGRDLTGAQAPPTGRPQIEIMGIQ